MKKKLNDTGFSFVELIIVTGILAFCLSGILYLFFSCADLNQVSRDLMTAISHAEFIMEDTKSIDYNNIASSSLTTQASIEALGLTYLNGEQISKTVSASNHTKTVTVNVSWLHHTRQRNHSITTIIADVD